MSNMYHPIPSGVVLPAGRVLRYQDCKTPESRILFGALTLNNCVDRHPWLLELERFDGNRFQAANLVSPMAVAVAESSEDWNSLACQLQFAYDHCEAALVHRINPPECTVAGVEFIGLHYKDFDGFCLRCMAVCAIATAAIAERCTGESPAYALRSTVAASGFVEYLALCAMMIDGKAGDLAGAARQMMTYNRSWYSQAFARLVDATMTAVAFHGQANTN